MTVKKRITQKNQVSWPVSHLTLLCLFILPLIFPAVIHAAGLASSLPSDTNTVLSFKVQTLLELANLMDPGFVRSLKEQIAEFEKLTGVNPLLQLKTLSLCMVLPHSRKELEQLTGVLVLKGEIDFRKIVEILEKYKIDDVSQEKIAGKDAILVQKKIYLVSMSPDTIIAGDRKSIEKAIPKMNGEAQEISRITGKDEEPDFLLTVPLPREFREELVRELKTRISVLSLDIEMLAGKLERLTVIKGRNGIRNFLSYENEEIANGAVKQFETLLSLARGALEGQLSSLNDAGSARHENPFLCLKPEIVIRKGSIYSLQALLEKISFRVADSNVEFLFKTENSLQGREILLPAVAVAGIVAAIAIPNFQIAREQARMKSCVANMKVLTGALELRDLEKDDTSVPDVESLVKEGYLKFAPTCPNGGTYSIEKVNGEWKISCDRHGTIDEPRLAGR